MGAGHRSGVNLAHAIRHRELCNLQMVRFLANKISGTEDKQPLARPAVFLAGGGRWWYPRALSLLLEAGADPNMGSGHENALKICPGVGPKYLELVLLAQSIT